MTGTTEATEVVFKPSTRRNSKSNNDRHNLHDQGLPKKKPEQRMRPKKATFLGKIPTMVNAEVSQQKPTVRVIMHSGIVQATGRCPGKERSIPYRVISLG